MENYITEHIMNTPRTRLYSGDMGDVCPRFAHALNTPEHNMNTGEATQWLQFIRR